MKDNTQIIEIKDDCFEEPQFEGVYGTYRITRKDQIEVKRYRLSLMLSGLAFLSGVIQWLLIGPTTAWIWFIPMAIGLGLALQWIHIYLRPLHKTLQIFWALGCLGIAIMGISVGSTKMLSSLVEEPLWTLAVGPLFAALTGLGFKEFFCFRRPEAIGLTLLVPLALLGHLSGLMHREIVMILLALSALLLLILSIRKFGMDASSDVGDKSVFEYLDSQKTANAL